MIMRNQPRYRFSAQYIVDISGTVPADSMEEAKEKVRERIYSNTQSVVITHLCVNEPGKEEEEDV